MFGGIGKALSSIGSIPGIGKAAGLGALIGGGIGLGGKGGSGGYQQQQLQQYDPQQMQLYKQQFQRLGPESFLGKLASGDQSGFEQEEAPAMRQFQELLGQNASRFSGLGMGGRKSSGFNNATNQATSDFAMNLASRRQQLQRDAIRDLMEYSGQVLGQRPQDRFLAPKKMSFLQELLSGSAAGLGRAGFSQAGV